MLFFSKGKKVLQFIIPCEASQSRDKVAIDFFLGVLCAFAPLPTTRISIRGLWSVTRYSMCGNRRNIKKLVVI